jgi:hypothetical protein
MIPNRQPGTQKFFGNRNRGATDSPPPFVPPTVTNRLMHTNSCATHRSRAARSKVPDATRIREERQRLKWARAIHAMHSPLLTLSPSSHPAAEVKGLRTASLRTRMAFQTKAVKDDHSTGQVVMGFRPHSDGQSCRRSPSAAVRRPSTPDGRVPSPSRRPRQAPSQ